MINARYKIIRLRGLEDIDGAIAEFLLYAAEHLANLYGHPFNWRNFDFAGYARQGLFLVCFKDGEPVGALLARLYDSVFDPETRILMQDELYAKQGSGRAAHLLFQHFIDFGRANANHIITQIAHRTNIKRRSLERLGFEKLEELYRLEV